ncbi:major facilitator superfamily domain-containing protein [Microdochium trichocladiopsis]|uniref:Major facilitator superfamily domain-containing protein n=1 Tax=Microdochium trichocladiopsis TaxID=1682393 RepID=A0A9P8YJ00_9PEZI|nr:major facilitator superfamily domain-containing protein [Microdochium trichocladiopsis]KAH7039910.1 major facilitator superfamily domain-containing protein [Microdochium trichocladiopsis]
MGFKEFVKRRSLKARDDQRTKAAELTLRQSVYPIALVTVLFFLWGFSYGLLDTLNKHFQNALGIEKSRSAGLQAAYFGAYPLASLGHANWILRHYGYRATFIWGLFLYCVGALVAWPCIEAHSFAGFCVAIFIIGNGLGSLETAANPYITVCGPPRYSEMRINLSQAFNGIGTILAPLIGSYAFFGLEDENAAMANVKWVYIAIAAFVLMLAVLFFLSDIPEITDADMAYQAAETHAGSGDKPFRKQYRLFHAAFAQFCYTGAQVAIASFFINYVDSTRPESGDVMASQLFAGAQGAFALGRFVGVILMKFVKPRIVFLVFLSSCVIFLAPAITQGHNVGISMLYIVLFFESICFPTIVALGMRGLGRHSKRGSGFIVGGVLGGAVVPPLTGVVADHKGTGMAMVIPLIFFVMASTYSFAVNFVPAYRNNTDAFTETEIGIGASADAAVVEIEKGEVAAVGTDSHHEAKHYQ